MRTAFIGLGNMGSGMAAALARAGREVIAFDISAEVLDQARAAGCGAAGSAAAAVDGADVVITMLPAARHVTQVWREAVIPASRPGSLLIDCSTIDVDTSRSLAEAARTAGRLAADAPVSGGIAAARDGT